MRYAEKDLLNPHQVKALTNLRSKLLGGFNVKEIILFGSVARREADDESDIDLLILTAHPLTRFDRHRITDLVFEVNLKYGTNFSSLVVDYPSWETGLFSVLPIHQHILEEGVIV